MELFQRYFINTVKTKYVDFNGRAARAEFWYFMLFYVIIAILLSLVDSFLFSSGADKSSSLLSSIFSLALFLPSLAVSIRRLHDIGKTGWWVLISLVPLIGFIVLLIFYVKDSQPGTNEYGVNSMRM